MKAQKNIHLLITFSLLMPSICHAQAAHQQSIELKNQQAELQSQKSTIQKASENQTNVTKLNKIRKPTKTWKEFWNKWKAHIITGALSLGFIYLSNEDRYATITPYISQQRSEALARYLEDHHISAETFANRPPQLALPELYHSVHSLEQTEEVTNDYLNLLKKYGRADSRIINMVTGLKKEKMQAVLSNIKMALSQCRQVYNTPNAVLTAFDNKDIDYGYIFEIIPTTFAHRYEKRPILYDALVHHGNLVDPLIQAGADINNRKFMENNETYIIGIVKHIIRDINFTTVNMQTINALFNSLVTAIRHGGDINAYDANHNTALLIVCEDIAQHNADPIRDPIRRRLLRYVISNNADITLAGKNWKNARNLLKNKPTFLTELR